MLVLGTDEWATISSLATGAGTLVLAVATFAAVRSSNRAARVAEMALQEQRRPLLTNSRLDDPAQKLGFVDNHWVSTAGGQSTAEHIDGAVYLTISLRNVGSGIAVCQAWYASPLLIRANAKPSYTPLDEFHLQSRDLYIPPGDIGMWQGALRDPEDPLRAALAAAIDAGEDIAVELLYSDLIGRQRTITRFGLVAKGGARYTSMSRHWYLDWDGPRPANQTQMATENILRHVDQTETVSSGAIGEASLEVESGEPG
jgi:hypothetical protein